MLITPAFLSKKVMNLKALTKLSIPKKIKEEIKIIKDRDPAARSTLEIILCYPGFQALLMHRASHIIWKSNKSYLKLVARLISQLTRLMTGIEIHPGAKVGKGVFIDHGMGVVIGETTEIGDNCLLYQGVTLGGTGKIHGKRHPTLKNNVVVGAGAKVLGALSIGENTRIGAGSVVLRDVAADCTVVGVPGRIVHKSGVKINPLAHSALPDAEANVIRNLMERIDSLEKKTRQLQNDLSKIADIDDRNLSNRKEYDSQSLKDKEIIEYLGE